MGLTESVELVKHRDDDRPVHSVFMTGSTSCLISFMKCALSFVGPVEF
jgi:hypothetical protein